MKNSSGFQATPDLVVEFCGDPLGGISVKAASLQSDSCGNQIGSNDCAGIHAELAPVSSCHSSSFRAACDEQHDSGRRGAGNGSPAGCGCLSVSFARHPHPEQHGAFMMTAAVDVGACGYRGCSA